MKRNIAIIPAREGSKRIPDKNREKVGLMELWAIAVSKGIQSDADIVILTTDYQVENVQCAGIERDQRPLEYCTDTSRISTCIAEHIIPKYGIEPDDVIAIIQPTYPFAKVEDINWAFEEAGKPASATAQTIIKTPHMWHTYNSRLVVADSVMFHWRSLKEDNWSGHPPLYAFGGVVASKAKYFDHKIAPFRYPSRYKVVPLMEGFDIDTPEDLEVARAWYRHLEEKA